VSVGLITNELVTNSLKYAFPTERGGIVDVHVEPRDAGGVQIRVTDNGAGCESVKEGMGTRLVRLLAKQRGGEFKRMSTEHGCEAKATLPDLT
jgi:two-component sensor histidine kinase